MTGRQLDDTSRCPRGHRCEQCGREGAGLRVVVRDVAAGTLCLTSCAACAASTMPPPITVGTAERLVGQHRAHFTRGGEDLTGG